MAAIVLATLAAGHARADLLTPPSWRPGGGIATRAEPAETAAGPPSGFTLGCGSQIVFGEEWVRGAVFATCGDADWLDAEAATPLLIDPDQNGYMLSPFNREIARLLKQISHASDPDGPTAVPDVSQDLIDAFKLDTGTRRNPLDQLNAPDQAADLPDPAYSIPGPAPVRAGSPKVVSSSSNLPTVFTVMMDAVEAIADAGHFFRENPWTAVLPVLALLPIGLVQIGRRGRR